MRRWLFWIVAGSAVILCGFLTGHHATRIVRDFLEPDRVRHGDYRSVTDAVGSEVVLISTTTCPWCQKARMWLESHDVPYRDCQVDVDPFARVQLEAIGAETVPQLVSGTMVVSGYDEPAFGNLVRSVIPRSEIPDSTLRCSHPD